MPSALLEVCERAGDQTAVAGPSTDVGHLGPLHVDTHYTSAVVSTPFTAYAFRTDWHPLTVVLGGWFAASFWIGCTVALIRWYLTLTAILEGEIERW